MSVKRFKERYAGGRGGKIVDWEGPSRYSSLTPSLYSHSAHMLTHSFNMTVLVEELSHPHNTDTYFTCQVCFAASCAHCVLPCRCMCCVTHLVRRPCSWPCSARCASCRQPYRQGWLCTGPVEPRRGTSGQGPGTALNTTQGGGQRAAHKGGFVTLVGSHRVRMRACGKV